MFFLNNVFPIRSSMLLWGNGKLVFTSETYRKTGMGTLYRCFTQKRRRNAKIKLLSTMFLNNTIISSVDDTTVVQGGVRITFFFDINSSLINKRRVKSSHYVSRITPCFVKAGVHDKLQVFLGRIVPFLQAHRVESNACASRGSTYERVLYGIDATCVLLSLLSIADQTVHE